jgi:hypothetical protein
LPLRKPRNGASNAAHYRPVIIPAPLIYAIAVVVVDRMHDCVPTEAYARQLRVPVVTPDNEVAVRPKMVPSRMIAVPK